MKCVVISGVSGGMGLETAKKLVSQGYHVFGLDLVEPKESFDGFTFFKGDVRDTSSIEKIYKKIEKNTDEIEAIINLAGTYDMDSLVEMSEKDFINIFNTNVFGVYRFNKTFLPLLKDKGRVIIVSSELAPLDPLPFTGLYGITKSTIEKYAYSLRMELQLLNKEVVVIRPGAVETPFLALSNTKINNFTDKTQLYKYNAERFLKIINSVESNNIPPIKIANLVSKILNKKRPKYLYKINRNKLLLLLDIMPKRFQNWVIKRILVGKKKKASH